jgi:ABC-2 type transport system permease protein
MNTLATAGRIGLNRGRIELRHTLTNPQDLWGYLFPAFAVTVAMIFMRDAHVPGMNFSLSSLTLPSALGLSIAFGGLVNLAQQLVVEREDGTLLRAKAIPQGMTGYLVGKIIQSAGMVTIGAVLTLIPGLFLFHGLDLGFTSWLSLIGVMALGLIATMPIGAVLGSLVSSPRAMGIVVLPIMGLTAVSGIFYPITSLPSWLQAIGQVFPIYWTGLGTRAALLPNELAAVEIGHSWRTLEMVGVLGVWAVVGLVLAPIVLRRMARRESGSNLATRREKALQRSPR